MSRKIAAVIVLICLITSLISPVFSPLSAAEGGAISINNSAVTLKFPLAMSFSAQITSSVNITDIRLRYRINQMSFADVIAEGFVEFQSATKVSAKYDLDMRRFGGFPPGTTMQYWWAVKDANRAFEESAALTYRINDNRYTWKSISKGIINLYWYQGDNSFAQALMDTAQSSIAKLTQDTGARPDKSIDIYIYASSQDLQGSMIYPSEWTGGVSFSRYNIITIGISPSNLNWGKSAMTHELTHNIIAQVIFNPYSDLPVWLNEGLAMYNQGPLAAQFTAPLINACRNDTLLSVKMISSPFSAYAEKANLAYAESYTLVDFLIQNYGAQKISELLQAFKAGNTHDDAFIKVLGFDLDGLNQRWQPWVKSAYGK